MTAASNSEARKRAAERAADVSHDRGMSYIAVADLADGRAVSDMADNEDRDYDEGRL